MLIVRARVVTLATDVVLAAAPGAPINLLVPQAPAPFGWLPLYARVTTVGIPDNGVGVSLFGPSQLGVVFPSITGQDSIGPDWGPVRELSGLFQALAPGAPADVVQWTLSTYCQVMWQLDQT